MFKAFDNKGNVYKIYFSTSSRKTNHYYKVDKRKLHSVLKFKFKFTTSYIYLKSEQSRNSPKSLNSSQLITNACYEFVMLPDFYGEIKVSNSNL